MVSLLCHTVSLLCHTVSLLCHTVSLLCHTVSLLCHTVSLLSTCSRRLLAVAWLLHYELVSLGWVYLSGQPRSLLAARGDGPAQHAAQQSRRSMYSAGFDSVHGSGCGKGQAVTEQNPKP
jgi:hypothetical protein